MPYRPPVSPYAAGMSNKCPRCAQGNLYRAYLKLADGCNACGLDYSKADSGDGPAVFAIFIVGFLAVAVTFILRFVLFAPAWVALGGSTLFAAALIFLLLPPLKSTMIALQYAQKAAEGVLDEEGQDAV